MIIRLLLIVLCCFTLEVSGYDFIRHVIRNTTYGKIRGNLVKSKYFAEIFFGVPYASSPIGDLKFEYPKEPNKWDEVKSCTTPKVQCCQFFITPEGEAETEDCLYLNIISPKKKTAKNLLPVLVWIHGGSYSSDDANMFPIDGTINNLSTESMVVVFVNYRLGALGFMSLANNILPGNIGLEDQFMALRWVKNNIQFFNGNPDNITLTGESAGAACTSILAVSPKAKGLFQQIILRSGSALAPWAVNVDQTVENTKFVLEKLGCDIGNETKFRQCLRSSSVEDMKRYMYEIIKRPNSTILFPSFTPVIDAYRLNQSLIPLEPKALLEKYSRLPMLAGITSAESLGHLQVLCRVWLIQSGNREIGYRPPKFPYSQKISIQVKAPNWEALIAPALFKRPDLVYQSIQTKYFQDNFLNLNRTEHLKILTQALSDYFMVAPLLEEVKYYAKRNIPVYIYRYGYKNDFLSYQLPHCNDAKEYINDAMHGFDIALLFQSTSVLHFAEDFNQFSADELFITNLLSKHTKNFVLSGNPNGAIVEQNPWEMYTTVKPVTLYIDKDNQHMIKADNCSNFWFSTVPIVDSLKDKPSKCL